MRDKLTHRFGRLQETLGEFTLGQKVIAGIGTLALLFGGVMVFQWAATPSYGSLYSNLSSADASAVVDELEAQGVPYELANAGATIMVPKDQVYAARIALSGEGLPTGDSGEGYSLLDTQDLSTSKFKERTDFKRAMEGELARTIEAIDNVETAVVHLALPEEEVFADEQAPTTASVLIDTSAGASMDPEQVSAISNLVAASVENLAVENVTVTGADGTVLSTNDGAGAASTRTRQVQDFQTRMDQQIQETLDRVVGPGNATVQTTADLNFDKAVSESSTYTEAEGVPPLAQSTSEETYTGPAANQQGGVVGPDGQMDQFGTGAAGDSAYEKRSGTRDNAVNKVVEHRENAPGSVDSIHVGVVLDSAAAPQIDQAEIRDLIAAAIGIDEERGDTIQVSAMPFDRSAEDAAAAELAAAKKAAERAERNALLRNVGLLVLILLLVVVAWWLNRRKAKARQQATTYVVEQLRRDAALRADAEGAALEESPALIALESHEHQQAESTRNEIADLVERQPEDVAALLRGWLVER